MPSSREPSPSAPVDRTEVIAPAAAPAEGGGTGVWRVPPEEDGSGTVDIPPASPPPAEPAGGGTGTWQLDPDPKPAAEPDGGGTGTWQPDPEAKPAVEPDGGGTGTWQLEPEKPQSADGGQTGCFEPGTGAWDVGSVADGGTANLPPGQSVGGTEMVPGEDGGTANFAPDAPSAPRPRHDDTQAGRSVRSLSRQALTQRPQAGATRGGGMGGAPEAPDLATGRYRLEKFHAKGGMGEIWRTEDQDIGRFVALKKMRPGGSPEEKDLFLREAQITGQLEHPGVVPVHEMGEDENGEPFYVMKFVKGQTLTDVIDEYHAPPKPGGTPREVQGVRLLQIFLNICQTVAFAHAQKILHRDLKPDNVMVGPFGETLLLDWGLAKAVGQPDAPGQPGRVHHVYSGESLDTVAGSIKGTPSYMAPEVAEGLTNEVDEISDVYLLGGTLYHILTGKKPREAKRMVDLIRMARKEPPPPPRKLISTIPKPLEAICLKAMAHKKADRYASAMALAEDVQRYLAGEPVSAYRENFWERSLRWIKRHRVALSRAAIVVLVLGLVAFGGNELRKAELRAELARQEHERELALEAEKRAQAEREAEDLQNQKKATADVQAFARAADEAQRLFALQNPGTENLQSPGAEQTRRKAEEALAILSPWGANLEKLPPLAPGSNIGTGSRSGSPATPAALKEQMYAVSLLLAETKSRRGTHKEAAGDTLALLDRAAALREPTSGLRRLQAECCALAGNQEKAAEARRRADAKETPTTALDLFLTAERLRVGHASATQGREKQAWTRDQEKQFNDAIETYRRAIALDYNQFWSHFQLGLCYLTLRKEDQALNALDACVALRPESPWGYTFRGHILALLRRSDEARADLDRAIQIDPKLREPRLQRGVVNWLQKRFDEALADFDAVLQPPAERRLLEAAFYRGQLELDRGEEDRALADFTLVIQERPQGHPASLRRARIWFARGDVAKGMADLDAFLTSDKGLDANSPEVCAERGRRMRLMLPELPRPVKKAHLLLALEQLQSAVKRGALSAGVYDELGSVLELLGQVPAAIQAYTEAVKLQPKEARLLVKRGWAHEKLSQLDEAEADFTAATRLEPTHAEAHTGIAYIQACRGKETGPATRHATEAALQGAGDYLVLHNVACVYGKLSELDPKRAREYQDLTLVFLQREVDLWQRDRSGPDPVVLIKGEPAFPAALRDRPEFKKLTGVGP